MHKVKSSLVIKVPKVQSPDSKASNRIKPTESPSKQIQRYLITHQRHSIKLKKTQNPPVLGEVLPVTSVAHFDQDKRIKQLESELMKYKQYVEEYEELAKRNKRLEEQMQIILTELENRNALLQTPPSTGKNRGATLESSVEENLINQRSQQQNILEYIENLEEAMSGLAEHTNALEEDLKKHMKKDVNDMELRLMNYIFGLEEKMSEVTFRNQEVIRSIQTFRAIQQQSVEPTKRSAPEIPEGTSMRKIGSSNSNKSGYQNSEPATPSKVKEESVISMKNLKVSRTESQNGTENLPTKKKSNNENVWEDYETKKCENCEILMSKVGQLERQKQFLLKKAHGPFEDEEGNESAQHSQGDRNSIIGMTQNLTQRISSLQSHVNVVLDSSIEESVQLQQKNQSSFAKQKESENDKSFGNLSIKWKRPSIEANLSLEQVKYQLMSIMQQLQSVIRQCDGEPKKDSVVERLQLKIKEQQAQIRDLDEWVRRLRLQLQSEKQLRAKIQKMWKMEIKEEQISSPTFASLRKPISCVDPLPTKVKINQILHSIKAFEDEYIDKPE